MKKIKQFRLGGGGWFISSLGVEPLERANIIPLLWSEITCYFKGGKKNGWMQGHVFFNVCLTPFFQLLFVISTFYYLLNVILTLKSMGLRDYFKESWNVVDILTITVSILTIGIWGIKVRKELSLSDTKFDFLIPISLQCRRPQIFQTMNSGRSNNLSFKYQRFIT